tara:strand:+ start:249 stop:491 length:243 start_codon:yes stop_codon:yes gene_type:complete
MNKKRRGNSSRLFEQKCKSFARSGKMKKVLLAISSLLLPGLGHMISGQMCVGLLWFGVWLLIFTSPIVAILSAVHYVAEA